MNYSLYAFDFDGTLVNSLPDLTSTLNHVSQCAGLEVRFSQNHVSTMVGDGVTVLLQRAFPTVRDQEGLREIFDTYYAAHCSSETELYPDVLSTLNALKAAGKELVVITNKPQRFTAPMLINLELQEFFTVVYCGDTFDYKKPDPRVMQKLLGSRSIPAHDALMVGDSSNDIHCAAEAGVDSVLVMYGYGVEGALQSHIKPTYTVESLQELLQL